VLDLLYTVDDVSSELLSAVATCMRAEDVHTDVVGRAMNVLLLRTLSHPDNPDDVAKLFSFAASIAAGYSASTLSHRDPGEGGSRGGGGGGGGPRNARGVAAQCMVGHEIRTDILDHTSDPAIVRRFFERRAGVWAAVRKVAARMAWPREHTVAMVQTSLREASSAADSSSSIPVDALLGLAQLVAPAHVATGGEGGAAADADTAEVESLLAAAVWRAGAWTFGQWTRAAPGDVQTAWGVACTAVVDASVAVVYGAASPPSMAARLLAEPLAEGGTADPVATACFVTGLITTRGGGGGPDVWRVNRERLRAVMAAVGGLSKDAPRAIERFAAEVELV
jgi:hypothetical protein